MNAHFFPLFISISENESLRNLTNHFLVNSWFFVNGARGYLQLTYHVIQFSYDISCYPTATLGDKVRKAKGLAEDRTANKQLSLWYPISRTSPYIMLTTQVGRGYTCVKGKYPHNRFSLRFFFAPFYLPSEENEGEGEIFVLVHYHWSSSPENYSVK